MRSKSKPTTTDPTPAIPCCMENASDVAALERPKLSFHGLKNAVNPDPITPDQ